MRAGNAPPLPVVRMHQETVPSALSAIRAPAPSRARAGSRRVEQVAAVVARAIRHDRLQRRRLAGELEHEVDLLDRGLDAGADVVRLPLASLPGTEVDRRAVVEDVQPLALVADQA